MKIKNLLLSLVILLIVTLNVGCSFIFTTNYNINGSEHYNQTVTHLTPINVNAQTDRSEMVEKYLEATATVKIINESGIMVSMGSGIAIYAGGYIATNWHVINNVIYYPTRYFVETEILVNGEYETFEAKVLWANESFDLAVIRCNYYNIPFVKMKDRWINSNEPLRIAEEIWTLGTPFDESLRGAYSTGTISSSEYRFSVANNRVYEYLIQHSSSISNGSSGSGMFDKDGNLLGLNTLGVPSSSSASANDLYFSTPIYPLINIIAQIAALDEDGIASTNYSFPVIGISGYDQVMSDVYNYDFDKSGIYVQEVTKGGPAYGKLNAGDIITGISITMSSEGGVGYYAVNLRNDLLYALTKFKKGDTIKIYYTRGIVNNYATITLD